MAERNDPPAADPAHDPRTPDVVRLAFEVIQVARECGSPGVAKVVERELSRLHADTATVVVVGETGRGKSTLINALVDHEGLLPGGDGTTTGVQIEVRGGPQLSALIHQASEPALEASPISSRPVPVAEVASYATVAGAGRHLSHPDVRGIEVTVPSELLASGLRLIDTPGAGGLQAGHAAITLATLERADALLFVVDGESELTAPEVSFLRRATERIATVIFVLARIDAVAAWETVLLRDIELTAEISPAYARAPWIAVSARHWFDAKAQHRPDRAELLRGYSHLPELRDRLRGLAAVGEQLRLANAVHLCGRIAEALAAECARQAQSLQRDAVAQEELTRSRAAVSALSEMDAVWRGNLGVRLGEVARTCEDHLTLVMTKLRKEWHARIADSGGESYEALSVDLPEQLQAAWLEVETMLRRGLADAMGSLAQDVSSVGVELVDLVPLRPALLNPPAVHRTRKPDQSLVSTVVENFNADNAAGRLFSVLHPVVGTVAGAIVSVGLSLRKARKDKEAAVVEDTYVLLAHHTAHAEREIVAVIMATVAEAQLGLRRTVDAAVAAEHARIGRAMEARRELAAADLARDVAGVLERQGRLVRLVERATALGADIAPGA